MAHARMTHATTPVGSARGEARRLFFKADRQRAIDRYIDYFGGAGGAHAVADHGLCGETLLERLA